MFKFKFLFYFFQNYTLYRKRLSANYFCFNSYSLILYIADALFRYLLPYYLKYYLSIIIIPNVTYWFAKNIRECTMKIDNNIMSFVTVCMSRRLDQIYVVTCYIQWFKTLWTDGMSSQMCMILVWMISSCENENLGWPYYILKRYTSARN